MLIFMLVCCVQYEILSSYVWRNCEMVKVSKFSKCRKLERKVWINPEWIGFGVYILNIIIFVKRKPGVFYHSHMENLHYKTALKRNDNIWSVVYLCIICIFAHSIFLIAWAFCIGSIIGKRPCRASVNSDHLLFIFRLHFDLFTYWCVFKQHETTIESWMLHLRKATRLKSSNFNKHNPSW